MLKDLSKLNSLLIISDTSIYFDGNHKTGFLPVVNEVELFTTVFSNITWIGFNDQDLLGFSNKRNIPNNVKCIFLKKRGGKTFLSKTLLLMSIPVYFFFILKEVPKSNYIHVRCPSVPGFLAIILSFLVRNKNWWFKYAGNWGEKNPPLSYLIQRYLLQKNRNICVTINGFWENQPKHCLSFNNPCLYKSDFICGNEVILNKKYNSKFSICFVGHLTVAKGADKLLDSISHFDFSLISQIHIVGKGLLEPEFIDLKNKYPEIIYLHGYLNRSDLFEIYKKCHFLLLPSLSEGFPKVISEAANFGCIPIVSDISSIGQLIEDKKNGFLLNLYRISNGMLSEDLNRIFIREDLSIVANNSFIFSKQFNYDDFISRVKTEIWEIY